MKVCLVNTYRRIGGAAVAAHRLKEALELQGGVEVDEFYRFHWNGEKVADRFDEARDQAGRHSRIPAVERFEREFVRKNSTERAQSLFSLETSFVDLTELPEVTGADVINLHWVTFLQNPAAIRRLASLGKPVVWTLHDERAFTGGCHYTAGCAGFTEDCRGCPQIDEESAVLAQGLLARRLELLGDTPLHFVSPSHWLASQLRRSRLFNPGCHSLHVIPYSIDLDLFRPVAGAAERAEMRARLGLSAEDFCILAGCSNWDEERKGGRTLTLALQGLHARLARELPGACVRVVTCGAKAPEQPGFPIHNAGLVQEDAEMARLLQCCDVFVTMTREDNLPNMIIEALACGVPVLATAVGGIPEMVTDGETGRLVPRDDSQAMSAALFDAVRDRASMPDWARNARRFAENNYAHAIQAASYLGLFEKAMSQPGSTKPSPRDTPADPVLEYLYGGMAKELQQTRAALQAQQTRAALQERRMAALVQEWQSRARWLQSSFSYRLGSALTWPARSLMRIVGRPNDPDGKNDDKR